MLEGQRIVGVELQPVVVQFARDVRLLGRVLYLCTLRIMA